MTFLLAILLAVFNVDAKPRSIDLAKELKEAMYFDYVEISGYTDSTILYTAIDGYDGYYSSEWFETENFRLKARKESFFYTSKFYQNKSVSTDDDKYTTGYSPIIGEKTLIVINNQNQVSLFANLDNGIYQFWSPFITGSIALFSFEKPAYQLENSDGIGKTSEGNQTCWDGCLLSKKDLLTYAHQNQIRTLTGRTQMNNGNALFVWELGDSEAFYFEGIDQWEEKYLNKKINVKGILVQFIEGKSMLLDWEIIKVEE
jgi:hypothetical protein